MATILIVDDLAANRKFLGTLLHCHGHELLEAGDGHEAMAVVRSRRPDLVITDVLMPVMDGYEFVRQLRLDAALNGLPVIFYTAHYGERQARELALSSGVAAVLRKPASSEQVTRLVTRVLSGAAVTGAAQDGYSLTAEFGLDHLRLVTDKLSEKTGDLRAANERWRALVNIGLEVSAERNADRLLERVCAAAYHLFGATYVTLGIVDLAGGGVKRVSSRGLDADTGIALGDPAPGLLGTVVAERRIRRGDNWDGDPLALQLPPQHPRVEAYLVAPIASADHVHGWMCLVSNGGQSFTDEDEQLAMALCGQVGRIYELEREISERQQAEAALRHERDRAQRYLDTATVALLALDAQGCVTLTNRKASDLLGWTERELLGRRWFETCVPVRLRPARMQAFHEFLAGAAAIGQELVVTRSGEERLIEWRETVLRDDAGRAVGTFGSGTDITERSRAAETLRATEERMRFALESASVGIWDMDYASGELRWSEILEGQHGLQPWTFGGTTDAWIARMHPDDRQRVFDTIAQAMESGTDFSVDYRSVAPDGTERHLSGAGRVVLDAHSKPARAVGISRDVTARRALEGQYQQAQKMEAVGRLAGGVAHDFNNVLTTILGYCDLLIEDLDATDLRRLDVVQIQAAGERAAGLTRQLLAFSRKQMIEPTLLDLNVVVGAMQGMLARLIGEDVAVVLHLQPGLPAVMADRGQVEQIIMNLAVNARDAMPRGGTLAIATAAATAAVTAAVAGAGPAGGAAGAAVPLLPAAASRVQLTVSDTGTGITEEVRRRLFEPFFTTKAVGKGTGLGLATVDGLVTRYGGSVEVTSEPGHGARFDVFFPAAGAPAVVEDEPSPAVPDRRGLQTVLLVEDSDPLRDLTRRLLTRQGYTVLVAADAVQALQLFADHPAIDVVVTDVVLPGASGAELIAELLARRPGLKVVYMSGYTEETILQHGVRNAGTSFLHKPFTAATLGRKVREALDLMPPGDTAGAE